MRKRRKPVKNKAPMEIDFGRSPRWNCHDRDTDSGTLFSVVVKFHGIDVRFQHSS